MQFLRAIEYYEDRYDHATVSIGKDAAAVLVRARDEFYKKAKLKNKHELDVLEFWWVRIYWWFVELPVLLERYESKDATINAWMEHDRELDERLTNSRPTFEPTCSYCGKQGLRLALKELLHKSDEDYQSVLFMFDCSSCKKKSGYWEDGSEWVISPTPCPKCDGSLDMDVKVRGNIMTTTLACNKCDYNQIEKVNMKTKNKPDPDYERDRKIFCLSDERAKIMQEYRPKWEWAMRAMDEEMEKDKKRDVYDVVAKINLVKVVDLIEKLQPAIEDGGFIELRFEKPSIGHEFTVEFSCLDKNTSRTDAQSRTALKKAINTILKSTNWRLMSDGISYRLGYLSGRLRAYEDERDLAKLVEEEK